MRAQCAPSLLLRVAARSGVLTKIATLVAAAACSSSVPTAPAAGADTTSTDGGAPAAFVFTEHVPAGSDLYLCSYVVPSASDTFLVGASHTATAATHHVLLLRTDLASVPDGAAGSIDCYSGPSSPMRHMRGEVYGSQQRAGSFAFPAGVGLPVRGGEVLLVELHLLNAGAQDIDTRVALTLTTTAQGVSTPAGVFFFDDPFIDIPPGASSRASMRCLVPNDVTIVTASSHDHARAQTVTAFLDPPTGPAASTPFYSALNAANAVPLQAIVPVTAFSHVRFECAYQNVAGYSELFQGHDVQAGEMCVLSGAYYPAMDPTAESCALAPDDFGTGTATCSHTLSCVSACPPAATPPADLGLSSTPDIDPCWQRCVVASCPDASGLLLSLVRCAQTHCAIECAAPSSSACTACEAAQCPTESTACASDACSG